MGKVYIVRLVFALALSAFMISCGGGSSFDSQEVSELESATPASSDTGLLNLELSSGDLGTDFDPEVTNYYPQVNFLQSSVTVTPTLSDSGATVTVNGEATPSGIASNSISLAAGAYTEIWIEVTAEDGISTGKYMIDLFRMSAADFAQHAYLKASNAEGNDAFGYSVALSGDTLAVGAYGEDSYSGAVYVFTRDGSDWTQEAYLKASNAESMNIFGGSVALSGDTLAVGTPYEDDESGAVYVFE